MSFKVYGKRIQFHMPGKRLRSWCVFGSDTTHLDQNLILSTIAQ
jgi:hypothetical protein